MADLKKLIEDREEAAKAIQQLRDKYHGEDFTPEDDEKWKKMNADFDTLSKEIDREKRCVEVSKSLSQDRESFEKITRETRSYDNEENAHNNGQRRAGVTSRDWDAAISGWCKAQGHLEPDLHETRAARNCGININKPWIDIPLMRGAELRSLDTTTSNKGSDTIPTLFQRELERNLKYFGPMRQACRVVRTDSGAQMSWPIVDDTANGATLVSEYVSAGTGGYSSSLVSTDPTFNAVTLNAYKYSSPITVSYEVLTDSAFDLNIEIGGALGTRLARGTNTAYTTADGSSKPTGVVTALLANSNLTKNNIASSGIVPEDIYESIHALDPAYRPQAAFMMHDSILLLVRKLRDAAGGSGTGSFMWEPSLQAGVPDRLAGYRVWINNDMDSTVASGKEPWIFGDFSKFIIRDSGTVRIRRLDERNAEKDAITFLAFLRTDSDALISSTQATGPMIIEQVS